jgi:hypothetical protein
MITPIYERYSIRDERWRDDQYLYIAELIDNCRVLSGEAERCQAEVKDLTIKLKQAEKAVAQLDEVARELAEQLRTK